MFLNPSQVKQNIEESFKDLHFALNMSKKDEEKRKAEQHRYDKLLDDVRMSERRLRKDIEGYNFLKYQTKNPKYLQEQLEKIRGQQQGPNKGLSK
jgi:hypothetical protein